MRSNCPAVKFLAYALLLALRRHRPRRTLLRCAFTDTGLATAAGHDVLAALPFDAPWAIRRWLDRVRPRAVVLVESELWPALLYGCRARGIPVAVAGARVGRVPRARGAARARGAWVSVASSPLLSAPRRDKNLDDSF